MNDTNCSDTTTRKCRWLSFGRRRLVLWAVLVSFLCAWIGKPLSRVLHQRSIVAKIQSLGGEVIFDHDFEVGDQRLAKKVVWLFLGDDTFAHVNSVGFNGDLPVKDDDVALLTEFPETKYVSLQGSHFTDRAMQYVAQLPRLEFLELGSTSVTADGLAQLSAVDSLKTLCLGGLDSTSVTADGLAQLSAVNGLETLGFSGVTVTDDMLKSISTLSNLRLLGFTDTKFISADFEHLAGLRHLRRLSILDSSAKEGLRNLDKVHSLEALALHNVSIADDGSSQLGGLSHLKSLHFCLTTISDADLRHLADLQNLESLSLQDQPITDDVLVHLAGLHQLEDLNLGGTKVSDDGLVHLTGLEKLQSLWLGSTEVSDAGLEQIASIKSLRLLSLHDSKVSADGLAMVKNLDDLGPDFNESRRTVIDELERLF